MANNVSVKDYGSTEKVVKTTDNAGVHTPHQNVDTIAAGDNNIGNVDVVTLPVAYDAGAVGTTTQRTTLASNDPAVASLAIIDDWDESDRAKTNPIVGVAGVAAGAGAVGTTTQRTTLASDDPAVASLSVIDDWDESDRAKVNPIAGQAGIQGGAGAVTALTVRIAIATDANVVDTELPAAAALSDALANPTTSIIGAANLVWDAGAAAWKRAHAPTIFKDMATVTITTITTIWTPTSGKKFRLLGGTFSVSAACSVLFEDNAGGTTIYRTPKLLADTPYNMDLGPLGKLSASVNNILKATSSAAATIVGTVYGDEE